MKLDRNIEGNEGRGKYALLKLRELALCEPQEAFARSCIFAAVKVLEDAGVIDWGTEGTESEFFVIRLKDRNAERALLAYAHSAAQTDQEYANEIAALAKRAGGNSQWSKEPD